MVLTIYTYISIEFNYRGNFLSLEPIVGLSKETWTSSSLEAKLQASSSVRRLAKSMLFTIGSVLRSSMILRTLSPLSRFCVSGGLGIRATDRLCFLNFLDAVDVFSLLLERLSLVSGVRWKCIFPCGGDDMTIRSFTKTAFVITGWFIFKLFLINFEVCRLFLLIAI